MTSQHDDSYRCRNCQITVHGFDTYGAKRWALMSRSRLCRGCLRAARQLGRDRRVRPDIDQVQPDRLDCLYDVKADSSAPRPWLARAVVPARPKGPVKPRRYCDCGFRLEADGSCQGCHGRPPATIFKDRRYCDICGSEAAWTLESGFDLCGRHWLQIAHYPSFAGKGEQL
jgi:hypothetical protein